jgi:predicted RNA-binding protein with TRAM domain
VKEGDIIELLIEAVGAKGDGIGKIEGFVIFVPNCTAGEKVKVRITQVRERNAVGERVEGASASEKPSETAEAKSEKEALPAQADDEVETEVEEQEIEDEEE